MRISITRNGTRNRLACIRADGTTATADLGPNLPYHDLAHYVVECRFRLQQGFFAHIARGFTPQQLSDKHTIKSLGTEPYRAEILARALGSLSTGACSPGQFEELVNTELAGLSLGAMRISARMRDEMASELKALINQFAGLQDGQSLQLDFNAEGMELMQ
jgi:hypothetical protein